MERDLQLKEAQLLAAQGQANEAAFNKLMEAQRQQVVLHLLSWQGHPATRSSRATINAHVTVWPSSCRIFRVYASCLDRPNVLTQTLRYGVVRNTSILGSCCLQQYYRVDGYALCSCCWSSPHMKMAVCRPCYVAQIHDDEGHTYGVTPSDSCRGLSHALTACVTCTGG